ncbi:unnamed protein product [Rhizoctonia solani]|uniref:Uncharacterized protein n=1 Tax=Rhizoctonia solani TaxID=456999 RepID=A0A8H3AQC2_9AGAM|nr:unnamed protein product [Rhizoctonia solani]
MDVAQAFPISAPAIRAQGLAYATRVVGHVAVNLCKTNIHIAASVEVHRPKMDSPMTPAPPGRFKSMFRSILREKNTPGSGQSVRWGARDAYRTITPNTSAEGAPNTPLLDDEESNSFMDRLQNGSSEDHGEKIDQLAAMGQSVGSRFAASGSTTPPMPGPSKASTSTLPPIPRPRFNPSAPSTSSPLSHDDSSTSFPDSMSPGPDQLPSHKPFDMSREMDSIPNILDETSPVVSDSSMSARRTSRPARPSILPSDLTQDSETPFVSAADMPGGVTDDLTEQARASMNITAGPNKSVRGMTTVYPPGMYNFTKSRITPPNLIPFFSVEPKPEPDPNPKPRAKFRDTVGSSSLDFIIAPGANISGTGRVRTSLPPQPLPPFDPPPVPTLTRPLSASNLTFHPPPSPGASFSHSQNESNLLARATTTKTFQISARELPTLYLPGGYKFDPTQIDPDHIPELSRFFLPQVEEPDNSEPGPDTSRGSVTIGHRHNTSVGSVGSRKSLQLLDFDQSNASTVSPSRVPAPTSQSVSRNRPNSLSSTSSFSGANPNSLADLTQLIESQYRADLAAHTALVPILLSRAETAEGSAQRLSCVVKDARSRVKELERLCGELGHEVGLLKKERSELIADRAHIANERDGLRTCQVGLEARIGDMSTERESLLSEIGNLSTDLDTLAQAQNARGVLDMASGHAMREMHVQLSRAEKEAKRSLRRKEERDEARARLAEFQSRLEDVEKSRVGWGQKRGALETEVRDLEVRVEREKDGSGAKEAFALERQQWEKERMALLDRAVRAEQALDNARGPDAGECDQKLRRQLDEYKAEVESQWKYAEQADATIKALEADVKQLSKQLEDTRKTGRLSSGSSEEWKYIEAEWEHQRAQWNQERADLQAEEEARREDMQAEIDALKEDIDGLAYERDAYRAELDEVRAELVKSSKAGNSEGEMKRMEDDLAILADRARHAEEMYVTTQNELRTAETNLRKLQDRIRQYENTNQDLTRFQDELDDLQVQRNNLETERKQLLESVERAEKQLRDLEVRCVRAENDRVEVVRDRAEIEDHMERMRVELEDARHERGLLEQERNSLAEELGLEQGAHSALIKEHQRVAARLEDLDHEHQTSLDTVRRLERIVQARNTELAQTEESIRTQALEAEQLRSHTRELERIKAQRDDALRSESQLQKQLEDTQKLRTAESSELSKLRERMKHLVDESTRSQRRINELMTESADKEVRIVQLSKARAQDLEDKEGLNVALQSKQQELELIKRKLGVRGTAGATPAPSRMQRASYSRRESTASSIAMETPLPRAMVRKDYSESIPSESVASVSSYSVAAAPLQTSSRANIYGSTTEIAITNTPSTVKPARRVSDSVPPRSSLRPASVSHRTSISVSSLRGVHFAASETTESETEDSDITLQKVSLI